MNEKAKRAKITHLSTKDSPKKVHRCAFCGDVDNTVCRRVADLTGEDVSDCYGACPKCESESCGASRFQRLIAGRPSQCSHAKREAAARNATSEDGECTACRGYGHFGKDDLPTIDKRSSRKCGNCGGTGRTERGHQLDRLPVL
jgi:hypothetical protein